MSPAAVGFQCPECIKDGKKTVREKRTVFGGRISANPQQTTIVLIAINVVLWLLTTVTGGNRSKLVQNLAITPKGACQTADGTGYYPYLPKDGCIGFGHWVAGATDGAPWQFLTSAFMHVEPWHIATNMISLWFLGPPLEALLGRTRFLAIYLFSALTGSIAVVLLETSGIAAHTPTLGASGAIFGLLGALLILSRRIPALFQQVTMWLGINLVLTFVIPGISWQGHVGGLIGGSLATLLIVQLRQNQTRRANRYF